MKKLFNELMSYNNEKVSFVINRLTINELVPTYAISFTQLGNVQRRIVTNI